MVRTHTTPPAVRLFPPAVQDGYDPLADFVRNASEAVGSFLGYVVGRVSDLVLSMLPATARRRAVSSGVLNSCSNSW